MCQRSPFGLKLFHTKSFPLAKSSDWLWNFMCIHGKSEIACSIITPICFFGSLHVNGFKSGYSCPFCLVLAIIIALVFVHLVLFSINILGTYTSNQIDDVFCVSILFFSMNSGLGQPFRLGFLCRFSLRVLSRFFLLNQA